MFRPVAGLGDNMNVMRYTVIDTKGAVSFIAHCDAFNAMIAACARNPETLVEFLAHADSYYQSLQDYVLFGLAVFDERNGPGNYRAIHAALDFCPPEEQPVFRVVDDVTREASLRPVKAGLIIFNLRAKRIIQMQNSYSELKRSGRIRVFDGTNLTNVVHKYALPADWSVVP